MLYKSDIEVINEIKNSINIEFCQFEDANHSRKINLEIKITPDFALAGRANKRDPLELFKDFILANRHSTIVSILWHNDYFEPKIYEELLAFIGAELTPFKEPK